MVGHVEDRWFRPVQPPRLDKRGKPVLEETERHGSGLRYVATWTESGKRRAKSFRTKDAANSHLHDIAKAKLEGTHVESHKLTVKEYGEQWMADQAHLNPRTDRTMRSRWENNIEPALGALRLRDVTKRHVQDAIRAWRAKAHSNATVHGNLIYTNAIFAAAVKDRLIIANPCDDIKVAEPKRGRIDPLSTDQVWQIAGRIHPRYQGLILLAAATGMRSGELRGITIDRVHRGPVASIRADRQLVSTAPTWDDTKTDKSARTITIDKHTEDVLDWHMYRVPPHPSGLIFTGENGGPLNPATISTHLRRIADDMHLPPRFGLHTFRHYHASLLIAAGLSPTAVAARLGHSNPTLTLSVYSHLWRDDEDRSRSAIEMGLFGH